MNTCFDKPTFIKYKVNGVWKQIRYDFPVTVYLSSMERVEKGIDVNILNWENERNNQFGRKHDGELYDTHRWGNATISDTIKTLPGSDYVSSGSWPARWAEILENNPTGEPITSCLFMLGSFYNYSILYPRDEDLIRLRNALESNHRTPFRGILFILENNLSAIDKANLILQFQSMFSSIGLPSGCSFYIIDAWENTYEDIPYISGEGTGATEQFYTVTITTVKGSEFTRAFQDAVQLNAYNIKIYSPATGFFQWLKSVIDNILPETPPFDDWVPDWLFDKQELDEYSNEPIEVIISCDCHPDCCKVCATKFPYFCCVKYRKN